MKTNSSKVIFIMGLPGTGKTFLAKQLLNDINAHHISSDVVRKDIQKKGQYKQEDKQEVYHEMQRQMARILKKNETAIVDATFYQKKIREDFLAVAQSFTKNIFWIMTTADEATIKERVSKKRPDSEADFKIYQLIKKQFEPLQFDFLEIKMDEHSVKENLQAVKNYFH